MESILYQAAESFTCAWSSSTKIIPWKSNPTWILCIYFHRKHLKSLVETKKTQKLNSTHLFWVDSPPFKVIVVFFSVSNQQSRLAFSWDNQVPSIDASWLDREGPQDPKPWQQQRRSQREEAFFWGEDKNECYEIMDRFLVWTNISTVFFVGKNSSNNMLMVETCLIRLVFLWNVCLMFWFWWIFIPG